MKNEASITSLMSAFGRAYHSANENNPIFDDYEARSLISDEEYEAIGNYILGGIDFFAPDKKGTFKNDNEALAYLVNTQIAPTPLARAKYCESALKTAVMTGAEQYVILGAGLDTFALREPDFANVFEVDHPLTQKDKARRIIKAKGKIPDNLILTAVDFSKDNLKEKLISAGFDTKKKSFFSLLGVSFYLTKKQIESTLESIADLCSDGSTLVFDYADERLFTSSVKRVRNMIAMAAAGGEEMKSCFSYNELEKLLEKHGFLIYELLTSPDIQSSFFDGHGGNLTAFEHINYVTSVYK